MIGKIIGSTLLAKTKQHVLSAAIHKPHTKNYLIISGDLHHQIASRPENPKRGMLCQDCHATIDMHGDGNIFGTTLAQVEIECQDCHGTTKNFPWELPFGYVLGRSEMTWPLQLKDNEAVPGNALVSSARSATVALSDEASMARRTAFDSIQPGGGRSGTGTGGITSYTVYGRVPIQRPRRREPIAIPSL